MEAILLTIYVLIWPLLAGITLFVITFAFCKEWAQARREGRDII